MAKAVADAICTRFRRRFARPAIEARAYTGAGLDATLTGRSTTKMAPVKLIPIRMVPNKMAPIRMVSGPTARFVFAAAGALAAMALPATEVRADYVIPTSQATVIQKDGDGQCSLWEAIDSINKGHTGSNSGLHGCKNDFGGNAIYLEGANTHYKSGGAMITKPMSIFSEADPTTPNYLENTGGAFVLKVMTAPDGDEVYLYGLFIQRISSTTKGRVIENLGNLHLEFCKVVGGDISGNGGGILNSGGVLTLTDSTVRNNKASSGGGVWTSGAIGVKFDRSTVSSNNAAFDGGGVWSNGRVFFLNSTVSDNTAGRDGGGVFVTAGDNAYCDLYWSTVANNTAAFGGGVFVDISTTNTSASIVASNKNSAGAWDDYFGDPHGDDTMPPAAGNTCVFRSKLGMLHLEKTTNDKFADPKLMALNFYYGGKNKTRPIPIGTTNNPSPAYNAIPANFCGGIDEGTDENLNLRPARGDCDIGAVEQP